MLGACSDGDLDADPTETAPSVTDPPAPVATSERPPTPLTTTDEVPVGGGVVVADVLVVQPTAGRFHAFSAVCPHQGGPVRPPINGMMTCSWHNSRFRDGDGTLLSGPARTGLRRIPLRIDGKKILMP
ncbi:nitrite reductase/ring-hydroxylating ferredoxin subunit [Krasilnikovia cinnamomea]|uniref:Nitrite reductase/ring-hydroxylating ferredoxin subunit n=2 Tax=Krasilnikovia cinnamomea TaxID=349313 RepID=A0A4Q7ZRS5_9ACTN|nr:nitrite reductase/ring-hydroxylating ferredoxin subunit [Krasilnikovia cinnamomea]